MNGKNDNPIISIPVTKIKQFANESTFIGSVKFENLRNIVRYTSRKPKMNDPFDKEMNNSKSSYTNHFQRDLSTLRIGKLIKFIKQESVKEQEHSIPIFPSAIILAIDRNDDYEWTIKNRSDIKPEILFESEGAIFFEKEIHIPYKKISLIVDGQHRIEGLESYFKLTGDKSVLDLNLPVIFLLGLDLYNLSKVFANINFEQKSVNKSLYYDIFGSLPESKELRFTHEIVVHLNNNENSPLHNKINLLGPGDGFFSQALFVDLVSKHFFPGKIWRTYHNQYFDGGEGDLYVLTFIREYFNSIKENWSVVWRQEGVSKKDYDYVLCNSTGMGALFRLMEDVYNEISGVKRENLRKEFDKIFSRIEENKLKKVFSKGEDSMFSSAGSYGLQNKLRLKLKEILLDESKH